MNKTYTTDERNYRLLLQLNLFLGIGISIVSTVSLFDLLYLRMQFDLAWFGFIRSCMYFLPALSYFCAAPLLKGTPYSREIVQWSYFVRIWIAVLIPACALFTDSKPVLLGCTAVCTTIAYVCAAFANNTLMILYRQLLPPGTFNQKNATISAIFSVTSMISLLGAAILSWGADLSDRNFYLLFILMEAVTGVMEFGVFRINRKLTMRTVPTPAREKFSYSVYFRQAFNGVRSPVYRQLLWITFVCSFFGLLLDSYINVYLFKVLNMSAFTVLLFFSLAIFCGGGSGILMGKWCDRLGYLKFFRYSTMAMIVCILIFSCFLENLWVAFAFLLLIFNGSTGVISSALYAMRASAASKFAPANGGEAYIAAYSLIMMAGSFLGSLAAGAIFILCQKWTNGDTLKTFTLYFQICGVLSFGMLLPLYNRGCSLLGRHREMMNDKRRMMNDER